MQRKLVSVYVRKLLKQKNLKINHSASTIVFTLIRGSHQSVDKLLIFGSGKNIDDAFGLIETVEKAAQIYMLIANHSIKQKITEEELTKLAQAFNVVPCEGVL